MNNPFLFSLSFNCSLMISITLSYFVPQTNFILLHISKNVDMLISLFLVFRIPIIFHNPDKIRDSKVRGMSPNTLLIPNPANISRILGQFFSKLYIFSSGNIGMQLFISSLVPGTCKCSLPFEYSSAVAISAILI